MTAGAGRAGRRERPPAAWRQPARPIRVGISACLLGEEVRFDGGHKRDPYITGTLGHYFTWVPVCPEVEIGLGTPRESLRLSGDPEAPRLVAPRSGADHTERMSDYAAARVQALAGTRLSGYILKRASPSCGMERVKVYGQDGMPGKSARGLFARALIDGLRLLPVEEEGRLGDARLRDHFITRVFAYWRLTALLESGARPADVIAFHTAHKYLLLSRSPRHYAALGRLVAEQAAGPPGAWLAHYAEAFMAALGVMATTKKHVNVLQHVTGFFKDRLTAFEKRELRDVVADYAAGLLPLIVPITLVNHYVEKLDVAYVRDQIYLHPHPKELMLRNNL